MRRGKAKAVCKQASSASLWESPPTRLQPPRGHGEKGLRPRAAGWGRLPQRLDAPSARLEGCRQGPPSPEAEDQRAQDRAAPHSPRTAAAAASAWPGGSSLSRQRPPEGTGAAPGAAAKPPTPEGAEIAAAAEAQRLPSRIELPDRRSHADPGGAPLSRAGGSMLRRDYRGAAGGDPPRSLQRRLGRSCHRRYWATAPPGPQAPLPQRDCGGRRGTTVRKRQGAQSGEGPGGARQAPPTASRRTPTTPPRRRKSIITEISCRYQTFRP
ncbi:translation initiation factor IF-2-like [Rhinolophus ferrumequinum]|uniref:translation initiation factor IF-2-like n=1 Tax=Rhinolophus ferrumequinum TaxID=59479 RepID=UPI00140FD972|nr:translation initiation factor IF-2-like [Rhinolophus ferrumequinum]